MTSPLTNDAATQNLNVGDKGGNGAADKAVSRLPGSRRQRGNKAVVLTGLIAGLVLVAFVFVYWFRVGGEPFNGPTWEVRKRKLVLSIVERGSLESANNKDINCRVKAKTQGGVASSIKYLVDDGTEVKGGEPVPALAASVVAFQTAPLPLFSAATLFPNRGVGDKLIELDDSYFQDQLKTQRINVDKAEADAIKGEEDYRIQVLKNESAVTKAINDLVIARLNLEKYLGKNWQDNPAAIAAAVAIMAAGGQAAPHAATATLQAVTSSDGEYQAALEDMLAKVEMASGDREGWLDRSSWSRRMYKLGFMAKTQSDSDQSRLEAAENAFRKFQTDQKILEKFTKLVTETTLRNEVAQKYRDFLTAQIQARGELVKAESTRRSTKSVFEQETVKLREIEDELAKCTMYAPQSGLVVYYIPENTRFGSGGKQAVVGLNELVSEGQKLMQIPDLSRMVVNTRVHEAMVSHVMSGQRAQLRVDAFPGHVFKGHVTLVKTVPSQADFLSSDVKVYQTMVAIDDSLEDLQLKPGMTAEVTIYADESSGDVLTIPIESVVGNIDMGKKRKCFVLGRDGHPEERDILVGMNNDKEVEVREGLKEGEKVVLNPGPLLIGDKSRMKPGVPNLRQEREGSVGSGGGKKKGGKGPKGPAAAPGQRPGPGGLPGGMDPAKAKQMWQNATPEQKKAWMEKMKAQGQ